jgi:hypothetical protein
MTSANSGAPRTRPARLDEVTVTDAWIFAALVGDAPVTTLAELVAAADYLNHSIPSASEVRSALVRLAARRLIVPRGKSIALTALGRTVYADGRARRGGLFSLVDNMRKAIKAPRYRCERLAKPPKFALVTDAAIARAYAEYRRLCNDLRPQAAAVRAGR